MTNDTVTASRKLDVFGAVRSSTGTAMGKHAFVGQLGHASDDETGYTYMRARYYDPTVGRFASEDPALNGENWFSYCSSDPVNRSDKSGKWENLLDNAHREFYWVTGEFYAIVGAAVAFSNREMDKEKSWIARSLFALAGGAFAASLVALPGAGDFTPTLLMGTVCNIFLQIIVSGIEAMGKASYPGLPALGCCAAIQGCAVLAALCACEYAMAKGA